MTEHTQSARYRSPSRESADRSRRRTYTTYHDMQGPERLSISVILAVAEAADADPAAMDPLLYESIDPDALDELFGPQFDGTPRTGGHVTFTLLGYEVTVATDGEIVVREPPGGQPNLPDDRR